MEVAALISWDLVPISARSWETGLGLLITTIVPFSQTPMLGTSLIRHGCQRLILTAARHSGGLMEVAFRLNSSRLVLHRLVLINNFEKPPTETNTYGM